MKKWMEQFRVEDWVVVWVSIPLLALAAIVPAGLPKVPATLLGGAAWSNIAYLFAVVLAVLYVGCLLLRRPLRGLLPSLAVVIKGYKVGTISDISYDPQRSNNVVVEFAIKSKFKIPKDTKARIFSDGIMSGKSIELELGRSDAYLHEGDTLFSEINKDFLEVAGSEFEFLKQRANDVISQPPGVHLDELLPIG